MRYLLSFFLIASVFSAAAQTGNEKKIRALLQQQTEAWNQGNLKGFMQTYWHSDSLMFIGKSGVVYGWQATLDNYKKGYPDKVAMGQLSFNIIQVKKLSTKYYQVVGKWMLQRKIGNVDGHFTLLLRKINGSWKIVSDHSS